MKGYLYVLRCADGSYYVGSTTYLELRIAEHEAGRIWIVATRPIRAGEEITFNYGYDLVEYREHPCRCGAAGCVGYIVAEEFHPQLKRILGR